MNIEKAIALMKSKDEAGLVFLYDHYAEALFGIIGKILNSDNLAEEVLQQSFLKIWTKIDSYDPEKATIFTWMARIARNTAIDTVRLKSYDHHKRKEPLDATTPEYSSTPSHAKIDVVNLTNQLEDKYRIVLETIYLQGYSHQQASVLLDIPVGTIKTRLRKSIQILRSSVKQESAIVSSGFILLTLIILFLWS